MKLLKLQVSENDILTELRLALQSADQSGEVNSPGEHNSTRKKTAGLVRHPKGQYRFINSSVKRFSATDSCKDQASFPEFAFKKIVSLIQFP